MPPILNSHRNPGCHRALYCRTDLFQNSFSYLSVLTNGIKLDPDIKTLESHATFCKKLLTFITPSEKSIYNILHPQRFKLLNGLIA